MIPQNINMLIVEDYLMAVEAYTMGLKEIEKEEAGLRFTLNTANSCDSAIYYLQNKAPIKGWDLAFLDLRIPPSSSGKYLSGEDIGLYIRKHFPQTKIIFITSDASNQNINSIFKNIGPEGFLLKNEISMVTFKLSVLEVIYDKFYFSKGVLEVIQKEIGNDFVLDPLDRKILYELSRGTKTNQLPNLLPLSLSSIARRKRKLKEFLSLEGEDDRELIEKARELGII